MSNWKLAATLHLTVESFKWRSAVSVDAIIRIAKIKYRKLWSDVNIMFLLHCLEKCGIVLFSHTPPPSEMFSWACPDQFFRGLLRRYRKVKQHSSGSSSSSPPRLTVIAYSNIRPVSELFLHQQPLSKVNNIFFASDEFKYLAGLNSKFVGTELAQIWAYERTWPRASLGFTSHLFWSLQPPSEWARLLQTTSFQVIC